MVDKRTDGFPNSEAETKQLLADNTGNISIETKATPTRVTPLRDGQCRSDTTHFTIHIETLSSTSETRNTSVRKKHWQLPRSDRLSIEAFEAFPATDGDTFSVFIYEAFHIETCTKFVSDLVFDRSYIHLVELIIHNM